MTKLRESLLKLIEAWGEDFFTAVTPQMLYSAGMDDIRLQYQFWLGAALLLGSGVLCVLILDRYLSQRNLKERYQIVFSLRSVAQEQGQTVVNEQTALDIMAKRREQRDKERQQSRHQLASNGSKHAWTKGIHGVEREHLPTFFRS
jgi:hypothetical protein